MWKRRAMNELKGESFTETLRTLEKEEKEKENRTKGPEKGRQRGERGKREKARKLESKAKYLTQIFSKLSY